MRIFVMGGTGLVGSRLIQRLRQRGDDAVLLTRRPDAARARWGEQVTVVAGDPMHPGAWMGAVEDCDAVINLVGEGVFNRRWNAAFVQLLRDSRVKSTENVVQALAKRPTTADGKAKILVNASAIGYYGPHGEEELDDSSPPGSDELAELCVAWEKAAQAAEALGVRTVRVRIGVVLDREGGALKQMLLPFKLFLGGPAGLTGSQVVSWIHHEDMVGVLLFALDNGAAQGAMNATAPNPVSNRQFSKALGRALGRPSFLPTPKLALRVVLGKVASVVTTGQRVLPKKALALGYAFKFTDVFEALRDVVGS
jgi:uncharacterized protein (TIGR01777 family)